MAKILIVDDSRTSKKVLKDILERGGHSVVGEAGNGEEAAKLYESLKPDVVTMDITMPVLDGIGGLKLIREQDPAAKVIMVTAAGQKEKMMEALKIGAMEFVNKPFEEEKILEAIAECMKKEA